MDKPRSNVKSPSIIQICSFSAAEPGAFIASMRALRRRVCDAGLRHVLVFPEPARSHEWAEELRKEGAVRFVPAREPAERWAGRIARLVHRERGVLVNTHYAKYDVPSWLACAMLALVQRTSVQVVWSVRSTPVADLPALKSALRQIKFRLLGRTVHAIAVSEGVRERCVELGFPGERVHAVPNGINAVAATRRSVPPATMRSELGLPQDALVLLGFGRDLRLKGADLMIEATYRLAKQGRDIYLVVVGGEEVEQFARERFGAEAPSGLPHWLCVVPARRHVADYYGIASIFISASRREGFSYAIAESMANRLPVAVSDLNTMEWARPAGGTRFFPSGDARALAQILSEMVDWPEQEKMHRGRENRAFVEEHHSLHGWTRDMLGVYAQVQPALRLFLAPKGTDTPEPGPPRAWSA